jgi:hypothetical protein
MSRDWKEISKKVLSFEGDLLLSNVDFPLESLPEGAAIHRYKDNTLPLNEDLTAKDIRSFLWDKRKDRKLVRDRATIWKDEESIGLGVVTTSEALERLS